MITNHIHQALRQVRDLQEKILEKQRFKGYSGRARALGGCIALAAALLMDRTLGAAATERAVFWGWAAVLLLAFALNYGALIYWFLTDPEVGRDRRRLRPALEVVPVLVVGGLVTFALVRQGGYDLLYGTWMCLYGLVNRMSRDVLPKRVGLVGLYYILAGAVCLFLPGLSFTEPLVMGAVFFAGEWFGGLVLHFDERPAGSFREFFGLPSNRRSHDAQA